VEARTEVEVGLGPRRRSVVHRMHCEAPLLVRVLDEPGPVLHLALVSGAASPLGGDRLQFRLVVRDGATVCVSSVAASLAQPGPRGDGSWSTFEIDVGAGASLDWHPEPTVSVAGSDHHVLVRLQAHESAIVRCQESVVLGRHAEPPGRLSLRQRVSVGSTPVLDHETVLGTGALAGPGAHGPGRLVVSRLHVGGELPPPRCEVSRGCVSATMHVAPTCALTITSS
jgi:urease accessory protein